jgi:hypothetical protein
LSISAEPVQDEDPTIPNDLVLQFLDEEHFGGLFDAPAKSVKDRTLPIPSLQTLEEEGFFQNYSLSPLKSPLHLGGVSTPRTLPPSLVENIQLYLHPLPETSLYTTVEVSTIVTTDSEKREAGSDSIDRIKQARQ